jgi:superfamily I DNA and/or RNA helicase
MGLFGINGRSTTRGHSRCNEQEANAICRWIADNSPAIVSYARQMDAKLEDVPEDEVLRKAVGIVTPFSRQSALIDRNLKDNGIPGVTVGTVHRLQGDERCIVIFSSVYGEGDQGISKFYDRSHNMLNVAVSRAKDCFLLFGHPDIFGSDGGKRPSNMLRKRLQKMF